MEQTTFPGEPIASWEDYKTYVSVNLHPVRDRYLFRGQGDETWKLSSSFDRAFSRLPDDERADKHNVLLSNFRKECEHYPEYEELVKDDLLCLALAQHYGLTTRLLDWTDSPYVAAYFAFQAHLATDRDPNNRVAIWVLDRTARRYWSGENGVKLVAPTAWHNDRQKRQFGWFTNAQVHYRSLEEYAMAMGNKEKALRKITLPAREAERTLSDLDLMRISARELFADLAGAARNAYVRTVLA